MADTPIAALPLAQAVSANDILPIVQDGETRQALASQVIAAGKNSRDYAQTSVKADGSVSQPITYSTPFLTETTVIRGIVFVNYTGTDFATLVYKISNVTKSGFTILVGGGQSGTTVDIHYSAIGD